MADIPNSTANNEALPIPTFLAQTAKRDDNGSVRDWVDGLPALVDELADRWSLQLGEPYEPGGHCSWVAPAQRTDIPETGIAGAVLKVAFWHAEAEHEADALRFWDGDGAVRLYDSYSDDSTIALLLERCVPGTTLRQASSEPEQDVVIASLLSRLWKDLRRRDSRDGDFRPLQVMCDQWADEFEQKVEARRDIDPGLAREAIQIFRTFPGTAERHVLLCTDLHAGNVLAARREPWLVIDPKPYAGDPAYDPLQHMLNCPDRLVADPHGFSQRMADLLDIDAGRLLTWLFARCVQESAGDMPWNRRLYDTAQQIAP